MSYGSIWEEIKERAGVGAQEKGAVQENGEEGKASEDAKELYEFVTEEWKVLRNQCEAAFIKVDDEERRECEKAISLSKDALDVGKIETCLEQLSQADSLMEKLRRRI